LNLLIIFGSLYSKYVVTLWKDYMTLDVSIVIYCSERNIRNDRADEIDIAAGSMLRRTLEF
jgi:hypothetical protein